MSLIMDSNGERGAEHAEIPHFVRYRPAATTNAATGAQYPRVLRGSRHQRGIFYKLKKQGEGPREMKVGARTLITLESAADGVVSAKVPRRVTCRGGNHGRVQARAPAIRLPTLRRK